MAKRSKEKTVQMRLEQILQANFKERFYSDDETITIRPNSNKNQVIGILIVAALVMFPYLLVLAITLGDFEQSKGVLPICGILFLLCLYPIATTKNYDNPIFLDFTNKTLYIKNTFFWITTSRREISFDKIDSFYYTSKTQGRRLPDFNILSVRLKNGLKLTVQEFDGAEKASELLNEILSLNNL